MGNCTCMKESDKSEIKLDYGRAKDIGKYYRFLI